MNRLSRYRLRRLFVPSAYCFSRATEKDDEPLREIIRNTPMMGSIQIIFQKDPNFFAAEGIGTQSLDILLCREEMSHRIVGFGSRSVRRVFVNGKTEYIGYLSSLRAIPEVRGGTLLPRAYKALRELHIDGKVPFYFTTIFNENEIAKKILTSGRAGLPVYQYIGGLNTYIVTLKSYKKKTIDFEGTVVRGSQKMISDIVEFLNAYNAQFQLAPSFEVSDFESRLFPEFTLDNFYVARMGKSIVGVAGVWDQGNIKQTVVGGYDKTLKYLRPFYNMYATLTGDPQLPPIGERIRSFYISFVAIDPPNPEILRMLLRHICYDGNSAGYPYCIIGFNEKDPLSKVLSDFRYRMVKSRIYAVYWEDGQKKVEGLDNKLPHLEIATL